MQSQEAALAAVVERVNALMRSFDEFRDETKENRAETRAQLERMRADTAQQFDAMNKKVEAELAPLRQTQDETKKIMNRAAGGYLVLIGLAGFLAWATGSLERVWKMVKG